MGQCLGARVDESSTNYDHLEDEFQVGGTDATYGGLKWEGLMQPVGVSGGRV